MALSAMPRDRVSGARPTIAPVRVPWAERPPTDFELLRAIYKQHRDEYAESVASGRQSSVMVPIDLPRIASELGVSADSVWGRLYHHLDPLYGEERGKAPRKALFLARPGEEPDCINFPMLEAVYAGLWQQRRRDLWTLWIAFVSIGIAIGSLVVSFATA
jgi:hypothetical protein